MQRAEIQAAAFTHLGCDVYQRRHREPQVEFIPAAAPVEPGAHGHRLDQALEDHQAAEGGIGVLFGCSGSGRRRVGAGIKGLAACSCHPTAGSTRYFPQSRVEQLPLVLQEQEGGNRDLSLPAL